MVEVINYEKLGLEDLETETRREIRLADGRVVTLNPVDIAYFLSNRSTLAGLPSPGTAGRLARVTDDIRGLFYDNGIAWNRVAPHFYNVREFGILPTNTAAQNNEGWTALLAVIPTTGARIYVPASSSTYKFSTTITPTMPVHIFGDGTGQPNVTNKSMSRLEYTGTGIALHFNGVGPTNSILEDIDLQHSGTGTVGVEIDGAITGVRLLSFSIANPAQQFSIAGVRVGATANTTAIMMRDCVIRNSAPIGVHLQRVVVFAVIDHCRIATHTTAQLKLGDAGGGAAHSIRVVHSTLESVLSSVGGGPGILIEDGRGVLIEGCEFEPRIFNGLTGYAISIPSTAVRADHIVIGPGNFFSMQSTAEYAINVDFSAAHVVIRDNFFRGDFTAALFMVRNNDRAKIVMSGNMIDTSTADVISSPIGVYPGPNWEKGTTNLTNGTPITVETVNDAQTGNIGTGEDDLVSYTLPANSLWTSGMQLYIHAHGQTANNANNKQIRLYLGGTLVWDSTLAAHQNVKWGVDLIATKRTNDAIVGGQGMIGTLNVPASSRFAITGTWTAAQIIKVTGEATTNSDTLIDSFVVRKGFQ
jgi:hypothetical protein